ncbi:MAG: hypothetical protein P4L53_23830 [Candidatus Obscuribacterales bacterium]|nr:hypothetical protein [Candidatus Obscuribacterales bacterium]
MAKGSFNATIIAPLRDGEGTVHSFLLDIGEAGRARLPIEELRYWPKGAKERVIEKGSKLRVKVIHENPHNKRLVVSERAEVFHRTLDRLTQKGWRDQLPEEHTWHYRKGRWECIATWPTWHIRFRKR